MGQHAQLLRCFGCKCDHHILILYQFCDWGIVSFFLKPMGVVPNAKQMRWARPSRQNRVMFIIQRSKSSVAIFSSNMKVDVLGTLVELQNCEICTDKTKVICANSKFI